MNRTLRFYNFEQCNVHYTKDYDTIVPDGKVEFRIVGVLKCM